MSTAPGTVLILLSGPHAGKRVVMLKELDKSLALVTGPYAVNGVPLRRVNKAYCQRTSVSVDISKVSLPTIDAKFFQARKKTTDGTISDEIKNTQKSVDEPIMAAIKKADPALGKYLATPFTLQKGDQPHRMKF